MDALKKHKRAFKDISSYQRITLIICIFWNWKVIAKYHKLVKSNFTGDASFIMAYNDYL